MDRRNVFWLMVSFAVVAITAAWGGWYTAEADRAWFIELQKPPLYPPASVFGIAWTVLYALMAVAAWLVGQRVGDADTPQAGVALMIYGVQLVLQVAWCYVFFFAQRFGWAALVLVFFWLSVVLTTVFFFRANRWAGALLLPLAAWSSFALYLGLGIAYHHSDSLRDLIRRLAA